MNKKLLKVIAPSLAGIVLAGAIVGGTTYALFTDNSKADIAITSGQVKVSAELSNLRTYSIVPDEEGLILDEFGGKYSQPATSETGKFLNGGTASYNANTNLITLDKVTPGDKILADVSINNYSNVAMKYRVCVSKVTPQGVSEEDSDILFSGLKVILGSLNLNEQLLFKTDWEVVTPGSETELLKTTLGIELPADAGNIYQRKSTGIRVSVEAVQANADNSVVAYAKKANKYFDSVDEAINTAVEGETITLFGNALYHKGAGALNPIAKDITIDLNQQELRIQKDAWFLGTGLTIKNGVLKGEADGQSYSFFMGDEDHSSVTLSNLTCFGGFNFYNTTATIEDCSIKLIKGYNAIWADEGSDVTIYSGFYDARNRDQGYGVVGASADSTLKILGGTYLSNNETHFVSTKEQATSCVGVSVKGGTFNVNVADFVEYHNWTDHGTIVDEVVNEHQNVMAANCTIREANGLYTVRQNLD